MSAPTQEKPDISYTEESTTGKFARKWKDNPLMVVGLGGCLLVAIVGAYRYKHRGKLSTSNYLMQLRVTAQGTAIGCLTIGVLKSIYDQLQKKKKAPAE
ncbi:HIG1 domain family member 1A, mitochondrial-like [Uloborus diversus]|uniref:HIG1 domain family member 1A, mitochondrial-like n=1 Tax=Uloborus diversus TaxID=327109 RepID=UPI0024096B45|nr:HIG1 domain family member 1A, mitochondrial-like [Uloborus diversus]XP_054716969.1 HIG1 domain family member 1A, mitochondrial-like [Uloborus diversus]